MTFEKAADGSAGRLFVQLSNVHRPAVIDFKTTKKCGGELDEPA